MAYQIGIPFFTEGTVTALVISEDLKTALRSFLKAHRRPELVPTYLFFVERRLNLNPVVYPPGRLIYKSTQDAVNFLGEAGELWRQTEIQIRFGQQGVNEETRKIYICPFTGKVFGDNTHHNPQDAIYDWVSRCSENKERSGGLRVKRFFVSEDLDVIRSYIGREKTRDPITKVVYSSVLSGKLFNSKENLISDFKKNYLKRMSLVEVQNQNRFEIEPSFLEFIGTQLDEEKITRFVEAMAEHEEFMPYVELWIEDNEE